MKFVVAGKSDVGQARKNNEDNFGVDEKLGLCVVCDGLGGHASGEVASKMAVDLILAHVRASSRGGDAPPSTKELVEAVKLANEAIREAAEHYPQDAGMGTTVVAAWLAKDQAMVAHVGDSRLYRMRGGALEQKTADHSLVAEQVRKGVLTPAQAEVATNKNILTRALGMPEGAQVDAQLVDLKGGDALLLCSDGLYNMLDDDQIQAVLMEYADPKAACDRLVEMANTAGGRDNITVVVARIEEARGWRRFF